VPHFAPLAVSFRCVHGERIERRQSHQPIRHQRVNRVPLSRGVDSTTSSEWSRDCSATRADCIALTFATPRSASPLWSRLHAVLKRRRQKQGRQNPALFTENESSGSITRQPIRQQRVNGAIITNGIHKIEAWFDRQNATQIDLRLYL
jgi:hypothetical protein